MPQNCPFCNPDVIKRHAYGETNLFRFFYNHKPILPGHSLIVPKRHVETFLDLTDAELSELALSAKHLAAALMAAYGCDGIDMLIQNGRTAGASVDHIHWHIVPRKAGDIDGDPSMWIAKIIESEHARQTIPQAEIQNNIKKIQMHIGNFSAGL
ncbi:MAG: HIT family protein [Candidatus Aenigmatarchaeota archaeon]